MEISRKIINPKVDKYLAEGCGRCSLWRTPACKTKKWVEELEKLRSILLDCQLTEELKWSIPCYTYREKNIVLLAAFKEYCALSFFKGVLLKDSQGILTKPGENSQTVRMIRFTGIHEIEKMKPVLKVYIQEAIEVENKGLKVKYKKISDISIPIELQNKLDEIPALKTAFKALTPGRQRGYILYFSAPKQSITRISRIEKNILRILNGKGLNDW